MWFVGLRSSFQTPFHRHRPEGTKSTAPFWGFPHATGYPKHYAEKRGGQVCTSNPEVHNSWRTATGSWEDLTEARAERSQSVFRSPSC